MPLVVLAVVVSLLGGCGSGDSSKPTASGSSTTTSKKSTGTTSTGTTSTTKSGSKSGGTCDLTKAPAINAKARFSKAGKSEAIAVDIKRRGIAAKVTYSSSAITDSVATKGKKPQEWKPSGGSFVVITFKLENSGGKSVRVSDVARRFVVKAGGDYYAASKGCRAAALYARQHKLAAPGLQVQAKKSVSSAVAYVLPDSAKNARWVGTGTGKYVALPGK